MPSYEDIDGGTNWLPKSSVYGGQSFSQSVYSNESEWWRWWKRMMIKVGGGGIPGGDQASPKREMYILNEYLNRHKKLHIWYLNTLVQRYKIYHKVGMTCHHK